MIKNNREVSLLSICLVSSEIDGFLDNGFGGSFYADAARFLAEAGHDVTLLYSGGVSCDQKTIDLVVESYKEKKVELVVLPENAVPLDTPVSLVAPYAVFDWMKSQEFDLVHVSAKLGLGFYLALSRYEGLFLNDTKVCINIHKMSAYQRLEEGLFVYDPEEFCSDFMERRSVELADHVIFWDGDVAGWIEGQNWKMPSGSISDFSSVAEDESLMKSRWLDFHSVLGNFKQSKVEKESPLKDPLVSVCVVHYDRPEFLRQAIQSIQKQDYSSFEVVLVDDGSSGKESIDLLDEIEPEFKEKGWSVVRQKNRYLGAARNAAAAIAKGEYLLFMDDDNLAMLGEISTLMGVVSRTGADVLTSGMNYFEGDKLSDGDQPVRRKVFLGGALNVGFVWNMYGDANFVVKKDVFKKLGGFSEDYGLGFEDWEFLSKAALKGFYVETIPVPLFWYRKSSASMVETTPLLKNMKRVFRMYEDEAPETLKPILAMAMGRHLKCGEFGKKYELLSKEHNRRMNEFADYVDMHKSFMNRPAIRLVNTLGPKLAKVSWLYKGISSLIKGFSRLMKPPCSAPEKKK